MHLVTGGGEKQLAGIMMQAEADLDELIVAYSEVSCSHFLTATLALSCQSHHLFRRWASTKLCLSWMHATKSVMRCLANLGELVL